VNNDDTERQNAAGSTAARQEAARKGILEKLKPVTGAWSVNGRDVVFITDFDLGAEIGGFLTITTPDRVRLLVQIHDLRLAVRDAIRVDVDTSQLGGVESGARDSMVRSANVGMLMRFVEGEGAIVGALHADGVTRAHADGFADGAIELSAARDVQALVESTLGSSAGLVVGRLSRAAVDATLKASGFARHTFICGQSGSGKTYSMGVLLERLLLETDLPLVIVDPNSDYVGLGHLRSRDEINRSRTTPLSQAAYGRLKARYRAQARVAVASVSGGDLPLKIHLSDLTLEEQALTLGLDPITDSDEFACLDQAVRTIASDRYGISDVAASLGTQGDEPSRRLAQRISNLGISAWSVWAALGEPSLTELGLGHRALVLDTGSLADARERSVVALALLGRLRRRPNRSAVSVVIDEAHNVCSPDATSPLERAVADHTVWIAGEGRKFGIYLVLATQRPQKVHRNVISQCDNLLLMRVNSVADLAELSQVFSHVPASMVAEARSFQLGEMLAAGPVASTPIRLRMGERWSPEGGADLPTTWASRR
jgi:uncharacterized protein